MRRLLFAAVLLATAPARADDDASALVKRQTQAMYNALAPADPGVWDAALDKDALVTDENGTFAGKKDAVARVTPLPKGISGKIVLDDWRFVRRGDMAVAAYVVDEHE